MGRKQNAVLAVLLFLLMLVLFMAVSGRISADVQHRGEENLSRALNSAITYCYASEGHYPESLDALVQRYGLNWDRESYFIDYRFQGGNVFPDVTIIRLK